LTISVKYCKRSLWIPHKQSQNVLTKAIGVAPSRIIETTLAKRKIGGALALIIPLKEKTAQMAVNTRLLKKPRL
jgi:hypothetical protein